SLPRPASMPRPGTPSTAGSSRPSPPRTPRASLPLARGGRRRSRPGPRRGAGGPERPAGDGAHRHDEDRQPGQEVEGDEGVLEPVEVARRHGGVVENPDEA